jgi:hypothetical protein
MKRYARKHPTMIFAHFLQPMPKCDIKYDLGRSWDRKEAGKIGKDFQSYDISWLPRTGRDNVAHEMRVEFGLGMYMRPHKVHSVSYTDDTVTYVE